MSASTKTRRTEEDPSQDMGPNIINVQNKKCKISQTSCSDSGVPKQSVKVQLREVCAANGWNVPSYECCYEKGPPHLRVYTYKVIVEIGGAQGTILECFGAPLFTKKSAADNATEGALWYLKHLGYFPLKKQSVR